MGNSPTKSLQEEVNIAYSDFKKSKIKLDEFKTRLLDLFLEQENLLGPSYDIGSISQICFKLPEERRTKTWKTILYDGMKLIIEAIKKLMKEMC